MRDTSFRATLAVRSVLSPADRSSRCKCLARAMDPRATRHGEWIRESSLHAAARAPTDRAEPGQSRIKPGVYP